jgi:hypothetical protein
MDGIFLGHNLSLSQAFSVGIPSWMGFSGPQPVVVSGLFFVDGILAVTKPFSQTFSLFTMEFRLSRSLSHELFLFSRWNFGYHEAFLTNFFFHDGISAITKSFSRTFSFFTMEFLETRNLGEDSLYIYIRKSIYIGSASLKTLPLDLEPPLQGKEYSPSYSNTTIRGKTNFCSETTYRHVIRTFIFLKYKLTKIEKLLHATLRLGFSWIIPF